MVIILLVGGVPTSALEGEANCCVGRFVGRFIGRLDCMQEAFDTAGQRLAVRMPALYS